MILHPGILSLIAGSLLVTLMTGYAAVLGFRILRKWDMASSSAEQLALERKTYLVSTLMNYVFGFEIISALLFIYTVDDLHRLFVGAMCATGSLNANPIGWYVLYAKIAIFFLASSWIGVNYLDQRADDYPLVRLKYGLLFAVAPAVVTDAVLQLLYFTGLQPDIITSCCGSLFSAGGTGIASGLSALPIRPMMAAFYGGLTLFLVHAGMSLRQRSRALRRLLPLTSLVFFVVALASIVSFVSLYFYQIPTHHCPFDILQAGYHFIGFPLYIALFGGAFFGMMAGLVEPFRKIPSLQLIVPRVQKRWTLLSLALIVLFVAIATWPIVFSSFTLEGYW